MQKWATTSKLAWLPASLCRVVVMYCPEGPFLWEGLNKRALKEYRTWKVDEIAEIFTNSKWLLADFIPFSNLKAVAHTLGCRVADYNCALGIGESGQKYKSFKDMHFRDTENLTSDWRVLEDDDVRNFYLETIRQRRSQTPRSRGSEFAWDVMAVELAPNEDEDDQELSEINSDEEGTLNEIRHCWK